MTILAAIDERERSERVVSLAYDLATAFDEPLIALHVIPRGDFEAHRKSIQGIPGMPDLSLTQERESAERVAAEFVRRTLGEAALDRIEPRGRVGTVVDEILAEVDRVEPRFVVISGRRRTPAGKALFGNKAQRVLLNSAYPVVTTLSDS